MRACSIRIGNSWGKIKTVLPVEVVKYKPNAKTVPVTLAGVWRGFPEFLVQRLDVAAHLDPVHPEHEDKLLEIPLHGVNQGGFSGEVFLPPENTVNPVRYIGFDRAGRQIFGTGPFNIWTQPDESGLSVTFHQRIKASVCRTVNWGRLDDKMLVAVYYDVQRVPAGTTQLSLAFKINNGESRRIVISWQGAGKYEFTWQVPKGSDDQLAERVGKTFSLGTVLRAMSPQGEEMVDLAFLRGAVTVYQEMT